LADVFPHPFKGRNLIHGVIVARRLVWLCASQGRVGKLAEHADPKVEGHHHHTLCGEGGSVVSGHRGVALFVGSGEEPHHDRPLGPCSVVGSPDVEVQTVLVHGPAAQDLGGVAGNEVLRTHGPKVVGVPSALPSCWWLRGMPPQLAHRRSRVGDALEARYTIFDDSDQCALIDRHHRPLIGSNRRDGDEPNEQPGHERFPDHVDSLRIPPQ
jgi:hypothetical protein